MHASALTRYATTALIEMRRTLSLAVAVTLLATAPATAKVLVEKARVCGVGDCNTVAAAQGHQLPFELLGPAIETGRRSKAPPGVASEPRYRVTLNTRPGGDVVRVDYLPGPDYIRVRGRSNAEAGGALLNRGWVRLGPGRAHAYPQRASESKAYQGLVEGLTPFPGSDSELPGSDDGEGSGFPWLAVVAGALAAGAALLLSFIRLSTRPPRSPASS